MGRGGYVGLSTAMTVGSSTGGTSFIGAYKGAGSLSFSTGVDYDLDLSLPDVDTDGLDNGSGHWIASRDGIWEIQANLTVVAPADATHHPFSLKAQLSGNIIGAASKTVYCQGDNVSFQISVKQVFSAGYVIDFHFLQTSGATVSTTSGGSFSAQWLGADTTP